MFKAVACFLWTFLLLLSVDGENRVEYDSSKGFTPAQRSLTTALLKLAESMEVHGSPRPYIEHVLGEETRINEKYEKVFGKKSGVRPPYLTEDYVVNLLQQWEKLEGPLKLKNLSKEAGENIRHAIMGAWNKRPTDMAGEETKLDQAEKRTLEYFLEKPYFTNTDAKKLEEFYRDGGPFDRLSKQGKDAMTWRMNLGSMPPAQREKKIAEEKRMLTGGTMIVDILNEHQKRVMADIEKPGKRVVTSDTLEQELLKRLSLEGEVKNLEGYKWNERDAIGHSHMVRSLFRERFRKFEGKISKEGERITKNNLTLMAENLLVFVHMEFMLGLAEKSASNELSSR